MLALDERGGLAHVLLLWGALGRREERPRIELGTLALSSPFTPHRWWEGTGKVWLNQDFGPPYNMLALGLQVLGLKLVWGRW